jgi:hypothetical protein
MDPVDFENLVADLFHMEVMTIARSGDGGVDVVAMDPDQIRCGKLIANWLVCAIWRVQVLTSTDMRGSKCVTDDSMISNDACSHLEIFIAIGFYQVRGGDSAEA